MVSSTPANSPVVLGGSFYTVSAGSLFAAVVVVALDAAGNALSLLIYLVCLRGHGLYRICEKFDSNKYCPMKTKIKFVCMSLHKYGLKLNTIKYKHKAKDLCKRRDSETPLLWKYDPEEVTKGVLEGDGPS